MWDPDVIRMSSSWQSSVRLHMGPMWDTLWGLLDTLEVSFRNLSADIFILNLGEGEPCDTSGRTEGMATKQKTHRLEKGLL